MDVFGPYCAYCELKLTDSPHVEHMVPKSGYPMFALDWQNLCLACSACNVRKGPNPTRSVVTGWLTTGHPLPTDYRDEIRTHHYRWPDYDDTHRLFGFEFEYEDPIGTWNGCTPQQSVNQGNRRVKTVRTEGKVYADLPSLGKANVPVRVRVTSNKDSRADEMIKLCGLDRDDIPNRTSDRRTSQRSEAWLEAITAWWDEVPDPRNLPPGLPRTLINHAASKGFFSVWVAVAERIDSDPNHPLARLFVNESLHRFPGTDTGRVP